MRETLLEYREGLDDIWGEIHLMSWHGGEHFILNEYLHTPDISFILSRITERDIPQVA